MESFTRTNEKNVRQLFAESTGVSVPQKRRLKGHGALIVLLAVLVLVGSTATIAYATGGLDYFRFVAGTTKKLDMDVIEVKYLNEPAVAEYAKAQGSGPVYAAPEGTYYDDDHNVIGISEHTVTQPALFYDAETFTKVTGLEITGLDRLFGQADWSARYPSTHEPSIILDIWNRKGIGTVIFDAMVDETPLHVIGDFAIPGYEEGEGIGFGSARTVFPSVYSYAKGKKAYIVNDSTCYAAFFTEGGIIYQMSTARSDEAKEALEKAIRIMAGIE